MTAKQENFCLEYVRTGNKSEAYRLAYDAENMKTETINVKAYELFNDGKITDRVKELQEEIERKALYSINKSIQRDLRLIGKYEAAIEVLENLNTTSLEKESARDIIKAIGISGYNGSQDRISKQQGYFDKDNKQKTTEVNNVIQLGNGIKPNEVTD